MTRKEIRPIDLVAVGMMVFLIQSLFRAWAIMLLWGWFVAALFGVPPLTMVDAFGLVLFLTMLRGFGDASNDDLASYRHIWEHDEGWFHTFLLALGGMRDSSKASKGIGTEEAEIVSRAGWPLVVASIMDTLFRDGTRLVLGWGIHFLL